MKIKKIKLRDYGPIKEFYLEPGNFNVIFGNNETGKTTLVEALTAILFKTRTRYGKPENISIELEKDKKIVTLPASKQFKILSRTEIAPLLYIPSSESELYEKSDAQIKFWDSLKLMLSQTGSQIPFAVLIKKLREGIGYQPKQNDWGLEKKKLLGNENNRLNQLKNYIREIGAIEHKKKELKRLNENYNKLSETLEEIERSRKYKLYQHIKKVYNDYIDKKNSLIFYRRYSEEDLRRWQELEIKKNNIDDQLKRREETEKEIQRLKEAYEQTSRKHELIEKYNIKTRINQYKEIEKEPNYFYPIVIFLIGFITLILSFRLNFSMLIPLTIFLISIISVTIVAIKKSQIRIKQYRKEQFVNDAKLILPEIQNFEDIEKKIQNLEDEKIRINAIIDTKKGLLNNLNTTITREEIEKEIEELRKKTGCAEIGQLKEKIEEKNTIDKEIRGLGAELNKYLDEKDESKWQRLIDEKKVPPPMKEVEINNASEIEDELKKTKAEIDEIQTEIKVFDEVKKKQYDITDEKGILQEIAGLENRLKNYTLELQAVKKAEEILNQMSNELDNFIENILSGENSLSEYFYEVTRKYKKIKIENQDFVVVDEDGNEYPINLLSSGARDQLLLCFRFSALKKLFPTGTFLFLDDAFIFADWERRCRLAELLKKFVDEGNQVFYFTSDEHSRDLLARYGASVTAL
uniref:Rad50/SbcC-type AAA domain-containing protein n=1 Tax=candidate division WOR-3 bacterium TaxID=2052148 RepID=A0A7V0Z5M8_UNCW3